MLCKRCPGASSATAWLHATRILSNKETSCNELKLQNDSSRENLQAISRDKKGASNLGLWPFGLWTKKGIGILLNFAILNLPFD